MPVLGRLLRWCGAVGCLMVVAPAAAQIPFDRVVVDPDMAGDVKAVADINLDGLPDLVVGGMPNEGLVWYRAPGWQATRVATPAVEFTTDGDVGDVDGDGDPDIIVPDGDSGALQWFENPRRHAGGPDGDPSDPAQWVAHGIGTIGGWGKDVEPADFDGDGRLDVATRQYAEAMIFFQMAPGTWLRRPFSGLDLGSEGLGSGDIDGDGHVDLVVRGDWVRNPGGTAARTTANWTAHTIAASGVDADFKAAVADVNGNGVADVLFSSSEGTADVRWHEPTSGDPTGAWTAHVIVASVNRAHTLRPGDMDLDGDVDVVVAQMHTSSARTISVYRNLDGAGTSWQQQLVDTTGLHNGVVADIEADGDLDIFGANWTGNPPVHLWLNRTRDGTPVPTGTPTPSSTPAPSTATPTATPTAVPTTSPTALPTGPAAIYGTVRYAGGTAAVAGVGLDLHGSSPRNTTSDGSGQFGFSNLPAGDWDMVPHKTGDDAGALSALDAAWVLQATVGLRTLDPTAALAADVTANGTVSALDAALILRRVVGMVSTFPVATSCASDWAFVPAAQSLPGQTVVEPRTSGVCRPGALQYAGLADPAAGQDFLGVLFGDVTGNWGQTGGPVATLQALPVEPRGRRGVMPVVLQAAEPVVGIDTIIAFPPEFDSVRVRLARRRGRTLLAHRMVGAGRVHVAVASGAPLLADGQPFLTVTLRRTGR